MSGMNARYATARLSPTMKAVEFAVGKSPCRSRARWTAPVFDYLRDTTLVVDEPAEVERTGPIHEKRSRRGYESAEAVDELALEPGGTVLHAR